MKTLAFLLFLFSFNTFASDILAQAKELAMTQAEMTFSHLGAQRQIELISSEWREGKVYIEIGIGTTRRPNRIHNCFIATISNNGIDYISNLEQRWDEGCN
jgi:hypothetical protein